MFIGKCKDKKRNNT